MTRSKRIFDLLLAFLLLVVLMPVMIVIAALIRLVDGAPVFYISERMRGPDRAFGLIKFRTMKNARQDRGVTGGDKAARITRTGRLLRRSRMDELPQVFNILRGDMSFVGPRPPLRQYVDRFPDLYRRVLASRPGVTGLASLKYRHHEEKLLAVCVSLQETDETYARRCIPAKARLDLIYQRNRSLCLDAWIILSTGVDLFRRH
ncbi:MAG: sugar transferase [Rhodobacteraceae bacterium]|nr:sugar transferase [Paracoccaceae bacterium]MCP5342270.1 sugar transferase [Paracoccaceae bacterium]